MNEKAHDHRGIRGDAFVPRTIQGARVSENREVINLLLSWTEIADDGATRDPAQWADWERSIDDAGPRLSSTPDP